MPSEKGFSLVENLVAMVILSAVGLVVLSGIYVAAQSNIISNEKTRAESLARSQMEYIQNQPYSAANPPAYDTIVIPAGCPGYSFTTPFAVNIDADGNVTGADSGLQKITVNVQRNGKSLYSLEGYKARR